MLNCNKNYPYLRKAQVYRRRLDSVIDSKHHLCKHLVEIDIRKYISSSPVVLPFSCNLPIRLCSSVSVVKIVHRHLETISAIEL